MPWTSIDGRFISNSTQARCGGEECGSLFCFFSLWDTDEHRTELEGVLAQVVWEVPSATGINQCAGASLQRIFYHPKATKIQLLCLATVLVYWHFRHLWSSSVVEASHRKQRCIIPYTLTRPWVTELLDMACYLISRNLLTFLAHDWIGGVENSLQSWISESYISLGHCTHAWTLVSIVNYLFFTLVFELMLFVYRRTPLGMVQWCLRKCLTDIQIKIRHNDWYRILSMKIKEYLYHYIKRLEFSVPDLNVAGYFPYLKIL